MADIPYKPCIARVTKGRANRLGIASFTDVIGVVFDKSPSI
jgi:hypothetical protein